MLTLIASIWSSDVIPILSAVLQWGGWGFFALLLWHVYNRGELLDKWMARFDRFLLWLGIRKDKKYVARDIRGKINSASKKINKEAEGIVTKGIDIVWVNQENIEAFLRSGKVIIRMQHHTNQDKNVANAVTHYVKSGVLHTGKPYLPEEIQTALNLSLTKKILSEEVDGGTTVEYFSLNTLEPALRENAALENRFSVIELMEEKGLLTRILLREVRLIGKKLYPRTPTLQMVRETGNFFTFLEPFASHRGGDDDIPEWQFISTNIQIGVLFVARQETLDVHGLEPYKRQIERKLNAGCKRIYIFARNKNNVEVVKKLTRLVQIDNPDVKIHHEYYSDTQERKLPAVCAIASVE